MRGDGYLPGALVLAYALKQQTSHIESEATPNCICLVTDDVSQKARHALGLVYDKVIAINELRIKSGVGTGRSDRNLLMTRLEALRLGSNGGLGENYDKIILLDADVLPLSNYYELFALPAPAGIIMEGRDESYSNASETSDKWSWHSHYAKYPDFTLWRQYFAALYWSTPALQEYPMLKRICSFCY